MEIPFLALIRERESNAQQNQRDAVLFDYVDAKIST
jgi:hypothetical protein